MRRLIKLALVALGIRALLHWRKKRQEARTAAPEAEPAADPADELRRKLAASRDDAMDADAPPEQAAVTDRRADVHEQGRAALDEMNASNED